MLFAQEFNQHATRYNDGTVIVQLILNLFYFNCKYCGSSHQHRQCPACGKTCKSCSKKNHFAKKCWSGKGQSQSHSTGSAKHKYLNKLGPRVQ